jgi:hypothetical protein
MTAAAAAPPVGDPSGTAAEPSAPKPSAGLASKLNPKSLFTKTNPQTGTKSRTLPNPTQVKELLGKGGGIVTILRSIVTFLKTRFPMLAGTNALMSMGISSKFARSCKALAETLLVFSLDAIAMVLPQARKRSTPQEGGRRSCFR